MNRVIDNESPLAMRLFNALRGLCISFANAEPGEHLPWPNEPIGGEVWEQKLLERLEAAKEVINDSVKTYEPGPDIGDYRHRSN